MLLPVVEALKVQLVAEHHLLRFQWLDPLNQNLRAGLEHGRVLVLKHQPHLALVDFTNLPPISILDELWMSVHWFPQIARQQLRKVAIVSRFEHLHNQLAMEAMFTVAQHLVRFQVQLFEEPVSALDWLLGGRAALGPPLLAEWNTDAMPAPELVSAH